MSKAPSPIEASSGTHAADRHPSNDPLPGLTVVHEGRGGFIQIDTCRYPIEHIERGRFCIHFPAGQRHARRDAHLRALQQHVLAEPDRWQLENRSKAKHNKVQTRIE